LPLVIATLMLGVGLRLQRADFAALLHAPRAAALGLANMFILFPLLALVIATLLRLPPMLAMGLVLLAASPSASTSTLFTDLARGDTALSVTLTAVSKLLPVLTIPLWLGLAGSWFADEASPLRLSLRDTTESLAVVVLLPLLAGMGLRYRFPAAALRARPWIMRLGVMVLLLLILLLVIEQRAVLPAMMRAAGPAALLLCLAGIGLAWASSVAAGLPAAQRVAISIEVGMQSGGTAMAIAAGVIGVPAMAVPAVAYSVLMYAVAGGLVLALRWARPLPAS